jgi:hypothetical protein
MHWGSMVKEMLRLDKFYTEEASTLIYHKDYPPFISLFEMSWCSFAGKYSEMNVTVALHMLIASFAITPVIELLDFNKKNIIKAILISLFIIVVILFTDVAHIFSSIYLDLLLSIMFAYCIYIIMTEKMSFYSYIAILLSCITMMMSKQVGIAFLGIVLFVFLAKTIFIDFKENKDKKSLIKSILLIVSVILIVFCINKIWSNYVLEHNIEKQFDLSEIKLFELKEIVLKNEVKKKITQKFISGLQKINITNGIVKITYYTSYLFIIVFMVCIWKWINKKNLFTNNNKKELIILGISFAIGTIGYMFMMYLLYLFSFTTSESLELASFDRYMSAYFLAELLAIVLLLISYLINKNISISITNILLVLLIFIIILDGATLRDCIPQVLKGDRYYEYSEYAKDIMKTTDSGSHILVISEEKGYTQIFSHYYTDNRYFERTWFDFLGFDVNNNEKLNEAKELIKKQDYIYFVESSDSFNNCFKQYLKDGEQFEALKTYKVNIIDDTFELVKQ